MARCGRPGMVRRAALPAKSFVVLGLITLACLVCKSIDFTGVKSTGVGSRSAGSGRQLAQEDIDAEPKPTLVMALLNGFGLFYMFIALYIVCDEFFVPSLDVISAKLGVSPDVAGATFMAAGGSAPEFFTSLVAAVRPEASAAGIAAIVGSAVFNVLFVIGACGFASPATLELTWYPLARDSIFYFVDLVVMVLVFWDGKVFPYEAAILFALYIAYCVFMALSSRVEKCLVKGGDKKPEENDDRRKQFERLDSNHDGVLTRDEARADAALGANFDAADLNHDGKINFAEYEWHVLSQRNYKKQQTMREQRAAQASTVRNEQKPLIEDTSASSTGFCGCAGEAGQAPGAATLQNEASAPPEASQAEEEEENEPVSLCPPADAGCKEHLWYFLTLPLVFILVLTVPDVRRKGCFQYLYVPGFALSILWIAVFSYFMVAFTEVVGAYTGISTTILALTLLAWGTSVPDLLTSVLVTLQGHGDMAVSSSIGSNIFDVTVGLPVPWLIRLAIYGGYFPIEGGGLLTSVGMLVGMLAVTILSIQCCGWVLNKALGAMMMAGWLLFTVYSVYSVLQESS